VSIPLVAFDVPTNSSTFSGKVDCFSLISTLLAFRMFVSQVESEAKKQFCCKRYMLVFTSCVTWMQAKCHTDILLWWWQICL